MRTSENHLQGTDNVLADLGFADAKELSAKTVLAVKLNELIVHHKVQTTGFEPVSFSSNVWAWNTDTVATRYIRLSTTLCG